VETGENQQALQRILDFTRLSSVMVLLLHCYFYLYAAFVSWGLRWGLTDKLIKNIEHTGLFKSFSTSKWLALFLLIVSLLGVRGKKEIKLMVRTPLIYVTVGCTLYFSSYWLLLIFTPSHTVAIVYMIMTGVGFLMILSGGTLLSRMIKVNLHHDIFNRLNETFPQEERFLQNEYSLNFPAVYNLKGKRRPSWINIINPFRGFLVIGSPGSGKSWFIIQNVIRQHIEKGFCIFIYDFKYDDLSKIAYNHLQRNFDRYNTRPGFYVINFDDILHRCNPLVPETMFDITDAAESSRTIMMGLNREWIKKQGDFFVESPINFVTAIFWFLKKYQNGKYCSLSHSIELMQVEYEKLFPVLRSIPEIEVLINPFITAFENDAMEQLEGQVGSAKIAVARLSSPKLYYVLSGNDFTLDINNPADPKIVCMGNNPQKQQIYGAVLSLYISRMIKLVNKKDQLPCSLIFDEFPTIYFNGIDGLIATARSNRVATTLAIQDISQLKKDYGKEQADVIMNIIGNVISGQVTGETAKQLSERFGKIIQDRESVSINRSDTSISKSVQLEVSIPPSRIAALSSGEFVGMVADNPDNKIELKVFHAEIKQDNSQQNFIAKEIPKTKQVTEDDIQENYLQIKLDVALIIENEIRKLHLLKRKGDTDD